MARFRYMVQDAKGDASNGSIEAPDEGAAMEALQKKGYFILNIRAEEESPPFSLPDLLPLGGVSDRDLMFFSSQVATLLVGGIPLVRALHVLTERTRSPRLRAVLGEVTKDVVGGASLHKALGRHPRVFDPLFLSLVQAGEAGGQLPKVLRQLCGYLTAQEEMRGQIITAMAYPAILFLVAAGVLAFFVLRIVPTFAALFQSFGLELPPLTRAIIFVSSLCSQNFPWLAGGVFCAAFLYKLAMMGEGARLARTRLLLRLPVFGEFFTNVLLERLLTTMATLISSGVTILGAFTILEGVFTENPVFLGALRSARLEVAGGKSIAAALKGTGAFDPLVSDMIWMGEESGKLPEMIETLSAYYREQIEQFMRRFSAVIDPIMIVSIGGTVGVIVLAVFMPIFQLSQIGGR